MYRRPKFLETLIEIRLAMAQEADYDVDLFAEMARSGPAARRRRTRAAQPRNASRTKAREAEKRSK